MDRNRSLMTMEGVCYTPFTKIVKDAYGDVVSVRVGFTVNLPSGEQTEVSLLPSAETNEGVGAGNVFLYEQDEAITHVAWGSMPGDE